MSYSYSYSYSQREWNQGYHFEKNNFETFDFRLQLPTEKTKFRWKLNGNIWYQENYFDLSHSHSSTYILLHPSIVNLNGINIQSIDWACSTDTILLFPLEFLSVPPFHPLLQTSDHRPSTNIIVHTQLISGIHEYYKNI